MIDSYQNLRVLLGKPLVDRATCAMCNWFRIFWIIEMVNWDEWKYTEMILKISGESLEIKISVFKFEFQAVNLS